MWSRLFPRADLLKAVTSGYGTRSTFLSNNLVRILKLVLQAFTIAESAPNRLWQKRALAPLSPSSYRPEM